jgi:hypothetical protein
VSSDCSIICGLPDHQLIELGRQALTGDRRLRMRIDVANGEPLVRCQLLAAEFYEALKRALRAPELSPVERWAVMAAANQCLHAADASISPAVVLELRAAIAMLQLNGVTPPQRGARPILRVIEGGLSRA